MTYQIPVKRTPLERLVFRSARPDRGSGQKRRAGAARVPLAATCILAAGTGGPGSGRAAGGARPDRPRRRSSRPAVGPTECVGADETPARGGTRRARVQDRAPPPGGGSQSDLVQPDDAGVHAAIRHLPYTRTTTRFSRADGVSSAAGSGGKSKGEQAKWRVAAICSRHGPAPAER